MNTGEIPTEGAQDATPMPERFDIHTDACAEWLLRILANNDAEKIRVAQQAQEEL